MVAVYDETPKKAPTTPAEGKGNKPTPQPKKGTNNGEKRA